MQRVPIAQLRQMYLVEGRTLSGATWRTLQADPRAQVQDLLARIAARAAASRAEGQRLRRMLRLERMLWDQGLLHVAGVDEAGMSPLAGPVAAAAVILAPGTRLVGVDDSKKLDAPTRARLAAEIKARAVCWAVGYAEVAEIDTLNIYWAGQLAMRRALAGLSTPSQHVLVDGRRLRDIDPPQQAIVGGDGKSLTIAAASILAKTARDAHMALLDSRFPGYGFAAHKGYPVPAHVRALRRLGPTPQHRRSFARVREIEQEFADRRVGA